MGISISLDWRSTANEANADEDEKIDQKIIGQGIRRRSATIRSTQLSCMIVDDSFCSP